MGFFLNLNHVQMIINDTYNKIIIFLIDSGEVCSIRLHQIAICVNKMLSTLLDKSYPYLLHSDHGNTCLEWMQLL